MAYSAPGSKAYGDLVDSSDWNELVSNDLHFAAPPLAETVYIPTADATTTSTTFVDVDAVNASIGFTSQRGGRVYGMASFSGRNTHPGQAIFTLALDAVIAGHGYWGLALAQANDFGTTTIFGQWNSIGAGPHTLRLQFKTTDAAYLTKIIAYHAITLRVWE